MGASAVRVYNTLSRQIESLRPRQPGKLGIYVCGPTVYDVPHAGHARAAVAFDVLVRHLRLEGWSVEYVRNITDIDDKILQRAQENAEDPLGLSRRMAKVYQDDMAAIGCLTPDREPRVSEHLPQIHAMIETLIAQGAAYAVDMPSGARDVYFSVRKFPGYGKLSGRRIDELKVGARVEQDANKHDPLDFALWKGADPAEWGWPSPWGHGRPGWHIECSAMSTHYLGHGFDVHGGGMDLIFPHHENEIAQSEGANPEKGPMAHTWMHNGFVNVDKEKMSKSLGNFVTVRDVLARNDAEGFRWFLLTVQYRGPLHFDTSTVGAGRVIFPGVDEAERRVDYAYRTLDRLAELAGAPAAPDRLLPELADIQERILHARSAVRAALSDDLNTPVALAELGEASKLSNDLCDLAHKRRKDVKFAAAAGAVAATALGALREVSERLGLLQAPRADYATRTRARRLGLRGLTEEDVLGQVRERTRARQAKDFKRSDEIRATLGSVGIQLHDTPLGTDWTIDV